MRTLLFALVTALLLPSCTNNTQPVSGDVLKHPQWILQGNIYEVNVRQYTPAGTFRAFAGSLDRLRDMGVQTLWFMPINPISKKDRKGVLGSYYAVSDYEAINPEFGTMDDWKSLVKTAHEKGFKVIIDWVPNHTGADHPWLSRHPTFYEHDHAGKVVSPFDWTDARKLDYKNAELGDTMIACMKYWIQNTGVDGFRCDVASGVPREFWKKCIPELKKIKDIFMLAEADTGWVHEAGFDASYPWNAFAMMKLIARGERPAFAMDSVLQKMDTTFPKDALRMYFTSNHDENSWNKADYATMPGISHAPFAVLTQTINRSIPLIYSGQEKPFLDSISFFYKDTIKFGQYKRAPFYKTLLNLRANNAALSAEASFTKLVTTDDSGLYAYERKQGVQKVLVILNLSNQRRQVQWKKGPSESEWKNVFSGHQEAVDKSFAMDPWGYAVYEKR